MKLPALRADLQLQPAAPDADGQPAWVLIDALRGQFFRLDATAVRLLKYWSLADARRVLALVNADPGPTVTAEQLLQLSRFFAEQDLLAATDPAQRDAYVHKGRQRRSGFGWHWLHRHLFLRIPLWRPDAFLDRCSPWLERWGPAFLRYVLPLMLVAGLFLVSRDWYRFTTSFSYLSSLPGMLTFGAALLLAKLCHEFGHACMARRAGCRVHSMGLAFIVLMPMFYTDVTDTWRIRSRRTRLWISAGGVLAELILAVCCLLLWSLLADGPVRSAVFMLATLTWMTTLVVNMNPLMRFDGYFLLSDWLGIDNLQSRAFAVCRWHLREVLFGYGLQPPESCSLRVRRQLLLWGYCAWGWRLLLFTGIALAVYHLFFKLLGVVLMGVELVFLLGLPLIQELRCWWQQRQRVRPLYLLRTLLGGAGLLMLLAWPWPQTLVVPAVLESARVMEVQAPVAARILQVHVHEGQVVKPGTLLLELESPDLQAQMQVVRQDIDVLQLQLRRLAARHETVADVGILEGQLAESVARYRGLQQQQQRLQLKSLHGGVVRDLARSLEGGRWISPGFTLMRVVAQSMRVQGYVDADSLYRLQVGKAGVFIAEDLQQAALPVRVREIDPTAVQELPDEILASDRQGPIAVRRNDRQQAEPVHALYGVQLDLQAPGARFVQPSRGVVHLEAAGESLLSVAWRRVAALLIRESGF